jgi:hypothetical protein
MAYLMEASWMKVMAIHNDIRGSRGNWRYADTYSAEEQKNIILINIETAN